MGQVIYHASPQKGLKLIDPSKKSETSLGENQIFGSPSIALASTFMVSPDGLLQGRYREGTYDGTTEVIIVGDEKRFLEQERKGGSMYVLDGQNFQPFPRAGRGSLVQVSQEPALVLKEQQWDSALATMLHYGVKVYFIEEDKLKVFASRSVEQQGELLEEAYQRPDGAFDINL